MEGNISKLGRNKTKKRNKEGTQKITKLIEQMQGNYGKKKYKDQKRKKSMPTFRKNRKLENRISEVKEEMKVEEKLQQFDDWL